jgi:hypothetical protein
MNSNSFTEPCRAATLGGAFVWLAMGCGGTTGREGIVRLAVDDASADSSLDAIVEAETEADAVDDRAHRRKDGALGDVDLANDDSGLLSDAGRAETGDAKVPLNCGYGVIAAHPDCDDCTNACTLDETCYACGLDLPAAARFLPVCSLLTGVATGGNEKGEKRTTLCSQLYDCVLSSGCGFTVSQSECYCGWGGPADCFTNKMAMRTGPCREAIENAAETTEPALIKAMYTQQGTTVSPQNLALGAVLKVFRALEQTSGCRESGCAAWAPSDGGI